MSDQTQKATGNAIAVQSGGDTVIHKGLSGKEIRTIIDDTISAQLPVFTAMAREVVDGRLSEFKERVLERFEDASSSNKEAFKDPDFQYLLGRAEHAYARSGDEKILRTLVDLIAQRSRESNRTRLALSLNEAVEKAAVLTRNEFAELSLCFIIKYTQHNGLVSPQKFADFINTHVAPLLPDISREDSSYSYLESQGCATRVSIIRSELIDILKKVYGGLISKGLTIDEIKGALPEGKKDCLDDSPLIIQCLNDATKLQLDARNLTDFIGKGIEQSVSLSEHEIENLWKKFEGTMWSKQELIENLSQAAPCIGKLFHLWESTPLRSLNLTSVGIAIGYCNITRIVDFNASLATWIK